MHTNKFIICFYISYIWTGLRNLIDAIFRHMNFRNTLMFEPSNLFLNLARLCSWIRNGYWRVFTWFFYIHICVDTFHIGKWPVQVLLKNFSGYKFDSTCLTLIRIFSFSNLSIEFQNWEIRFMNLSLENGINETTQS